MTAPFAVVTALREAGLTIATAESLTGGLVCSALVESPGASDVVRGGIVAYHAELKERLLGVSRAHMASRGAVDSGTAEQMAAGVRERCGSSLGVATTGVAGPDASEGKSAGTVYIALADERGVVSRQLALSGARQEVRTATLDAVLGLVLERVRAAGKDS